MYIGDREVSSRNEPFIIAEMSGNHNQSLDRALKIVDAAAESGVHALKLQTYTPDTMTLDVNNKEFCLSGGKTLWSGRTLHELYQEAYTPWEWHEPIFRKAKELGLIVFSTPFDETSVDFLEELDVPCYKIASFENTDLPLIEKVAKTGKPLIISSGMASISELDEAVGIARSNGCKDIVMLKCTSSYPASPGDINLLTIPHMRETFNCEVGLSDHTLGTGIATASVALGATVIEKHFTLKRADGGVDSAFSMEPAEMKGLVEETAKVRQALGQVFYGTSENEKALSNYKRSLYISEDMKSGDVLNRQNCRVIRPGLGLHPRFHEMVLGKAVKKDLKKGTPLTWDCLL